MPLMNDKIYYSNSAKSGGFVGFIWFSFLTLDGLLKTCEFTGRILIKKSSLGTTQIKIKVFQQYCI